LIGGGGLAECFIAAALCDISAILFAVPRSLLIAFLVSAACAAALVAQESAQPPTQPPAQQPAPQAVPQPAPAVPPRPVSGPVIVLDPAHGGTDSGARGASGAVEKDIVLLFARVMRTELERQGLRVAMTRDDDSNPSYDDRAAVANAFRDALFISLHISSTGTIGAARAYHYQFPSPVTSTSSAPAAPGSNSAPATPFAAPANGLIVWEEAQRPYAETSRRLADLLQSELAQQFTGSPATSTAVAVRGLRSVAAPAVAVEVSSVSASDPGSLTVMATPLATAIVRSVVAFRSASSIGAK
jgi:N-acetylmuramoyl-L-alanine amidase